MNYHEIVKPYKKDFDYSYASGAYAVIELLNSRPKNIRAVYIHPDYIDKAGLEKLCASRSVPVIHSAEAFKRVNRKENSYVMGVFDKYVCTLSGTSPHVVLVNPGDMGNLGTIARTIAGFGICDLAIITPAADIWDPKTVRASMGALFRIRFAHFPDFEVYRETYQEHSLYPFMLNGNQGLTPPLCPETGMYSLIFGNESTGLDKRFTSYGTSVRIPQSALVDSFNLAVAVGVGTYIFTNANKKSENSS